MTNQPRKDDLKKLKLDELRTLYDNASYIPYHELLRVHEWEMKRMEILDRDNFQCQSCNGFKSLMDKNGKIFWQSAEFIIWTDLEGNNRFSSPIKPTNIPDKVYQIHIHHRKYILNRMPWEYENKDLIALCNYCHVKEHQNNITPVFDESNKLIVNSDPCDRCNGIGYFPEYSYVQGGICFKCRGLKINILLINKKLT